MPLKGANIIVAMGVIAIFIAAFFILFIFDKLVSGNLACILHTGGLCTGDMFKILTNGLFMIFGLLAMIAMAAYVMLISIGVNKRYIRQKGG